MRIYLVGGAVRDELLGIKSHDADFTVVLDQDTEVGRIGNDPFKVMVFQLKKMGFEIFLKSPEFFTARARFPRSGPTNRFIALNDETLMRNYFGGMTADFVLARKEGEYTDGRRPDKVELGTLEDDLARRDFSVNAIAKDPVTGVLIDPFGGVRDLESNVLRAVGKPLDRLMEDALRAVRALRFSVTKGLNIDFDLARAMRTQSVLDSVQFKIADERIDEELRKMFAHDTLASLAVLERFKPLTRAMLSGSVNLTSTMKEGRRR